MMKLTPGDIGWDEQEFYNFFVVSLDLVETLSICNYEEGNRSFRKKKKTTYVRKSKESCILKSIVCCFPVAKLCPTLCDPVDGSMPGFPVLHHLPEFALGEHIHYSLEVWSYGSKELNCSEFSC